MPTVRIHNRTRGTALADGVALVITAGETDSKGAYLATTPSRLEVSVGKAVHYDVSSASAFRVTAEPRNAMMPANYAPPDGIRKDTDIYIVADNDNHVEVILDQPTSTRGVTQ